MARVSAAAVARGECWRMIVQIISNDRYSRYLTSSSVVFLEGAATLADSHIIAWIKKDARGVNWLQTEDDDERDAIFKDMCKQVINAFGINEKMYDAIVDKDAKDIKFAIGILMDTFKAKNQYALLEAGPEDTAMLPVLTAATADAEAKKRKVEA